MLLIREGIIVSKVYCKVTSNNIYLNLKSFAPTNLKRISLKMLVDRAYLICSNFTLGKKEIDHLKKVFHEKNDYLKRVSNQVLIEVQEKRKTIVNNVSKE